MWVFPGHLLPPNLRRKSTAVDYMLPKIATVPRLASSRYNSSCYNMFVELKDEQIWRWWWWWWCWCFQGRAEIAVVRKCPVLQFQSTPFRSPILCGDLCGDPQTTDHVVNSCPVTEFKGGRTILREAEDDAVTWLNSAATATLARPWFSVITFPRRLSLDLCPLPAHPLLNFRLHWDYGLHLRNVGVLRITSRVSFVQKPLR